MAELLGSPRGLVWRRCSGAGSAPGCCCERRFGARCGRWGCGWQRAGSGASGRRDADAARLLQRRAGQPLAGPAPAPCEQPLRSPAEPPPAPLWGSCRVALPSEKPPGTCAFCRLNLSFCLWEQGEHTCSAAGGAGAAPSPAFGVAVCPAARHGWVHAGIRSYLLCSELPLNVCTRCGGHRGISHTTGSLFWGLEDAGQCPE